MLLSTEVDLSPLKVPNEVSTCIYISSCENHCSNCHYPELQKTNYGDPLYQYFQDILALYSRQVTCVCFLGEGRGTPLEQKELQQYCREAHTVGFRTCLYSGRETTIAMDVRF